MAPHNVVALKRPRTLAHVLLDLKDARRDWEQADKDAQAAAREQNMAMEDEAGDRMSVADSRIDELQDEFHAVFEQATGVTWSQVQKAIEEAVL